MPQNKKESIHMYTFYHKSGASVQVMELEDEGWILAPDILRFFGYNHPLHELEDVDQDDKRYIQGVPFINKYAFKQFANQAKHKMSATQSGLHYYFREEGPFRDFCSWVSHVAIGVMRGMVFLPKNDDEWSFHIWRKDECRRYMEKVKREEGIVVEKDVADRTITIPIYCENMEELDLSGEKLLFFYRLFTDAYDSDIDLKSFANGFVFAYALMDHWDKEMLEELEEKPFEIQA